MQAFAWLRLIGYVCCAGLHTVFLSADTEDLRRHNPCKYLREELYRSQICRDRSRSKRHLYH